MWPSHLGGLEDRPYIPGISRTLLLGLPRIPRPLPRLHRHVMAHRPTFSLSGLRVGWSGCEVLQRLTSRQPSLAGLRPTQLLQPVYRKFWGLRFGRLVYPGSLTEACALSLPSLTRTGDPVMRVICLGFAVTLGSPTLGSETPVTDRMRLYVSLSVGTVTHPRLSPDTNLSLTTRGNLGTSAL